MRKLKKLISSLVFAVMVVTQVCSLTCINTVHAAEAVRNLEYVNVSGGSFNSGIKINQNYSIQISFSLSTLDQYKNIFTASSTTSNYPVYRLRYEANRGLYLAHGWANERVYVPTVNEDIVVLEKKNITYINGKQVMKETLQNLTASSNLVFGDFKGRLKGFKVWDGSGSLVADYGPVIDTNGKACMYDSVGNKFAYYSGTCTAGKVLESQEPSQEEPVKPEEPSNSQENNNSTNESDKTEDSDKTDTSIDSSVNIAEALSVAGGVFNSGIKTNQDYSIEITCSLSDLNQYKNLYIATTSAGKNVQRLRYEANKGLYVAYGYYNENVCSPSKDATVTVSQKKNLVYVNGKQVRKLVSNNFESASNLTFGDFKGKLYSFKMWDASGKLVLSCSPAIDSSGKACMYDAVNKKYIYYSGKCEAIGGTQEEEEEADNSTSDIINSGKPDSDETDKGNTSNMTENETKVYELLKNTFISASKSKVDISKYKITQDKLNELWNKVIDEYYVEFIAQPNLQLIYNYSGDYATYYYTLNADATYKTRTAKIQTTINEMLSQVDSKMTDLDKVLLVHEYIVEHTEYSSSASKCHYAEGPLYYGYGACSGYAEAMIAVLHIMGIEAEEVVSSSMNHGWLCVKLDGEWYHIDPTWDDTQPGSNDEYKHRFLIRNDKEFSTIKAARTHYSWAIGRDEKKVVFNSTKYVNWYVHDVAGSMYYHDGLWYYADLKTNSIMASDITGKINKVIVDGTNISGKVKIKGIAGNAVKYSVGSTVYTKAI